MLVAAFGYAKYRKGQRADAEFRQSLRQAAGQQQHAVLQARMPTQLPPHASTVLAGDTPPPPGTPEKP